MNKIEAILGYTPPLEEMRGYLKTAIEEGITLAEACSRFNIGPVALLEPDGTFFYAKAGKNLTPEEWRGLNQMHKYLTLIIYENG